MIVMVMERATRCHDRAPLGRHQVTVILTQGILGFMEGLNNNIRVIQRRAYGIKDHEYPVLKVITSFIKDPNSA